MKKFLIITTILASTINCFAQNAKIPKGTYTANEFGLDMTLKLQEDNTFELSYLKGNIESQNDSIFDLKMEPNKSSFDLVYLFDKKQVSDKIKITLKSALGNYESIFLGTQTANENPEYKSASTILNELISNNHIDVNGEITFDIKNSDYLYLGIENYRQKTQISKFKIPVNASEIIVTCNNIKFGDIDLQGIYNTTTKEFIVSENGKSPLKFVLKEESLSNNDDVTKPIAIEVKSNWTFPGKEQQKILPIEEAVEAAADAVYEKSEAAEKSYIFSHYKSKNLKESLNHIAKTPKKFLVVVFDLKNKKKKEDFDSYIKESEIGLTNTMYYGYNEQDDFFEYYLATEKDKSLLSKNKIKSNKELLVLNSNGELIYHTSGNLQENINLLSTTAYDNSYKGFNDASGKLEFDKVILNKKATNKEVLKTLKEINGIKYIEEIANAVDTVKFTPPVVTTKTAVDDATKAVQEAVDSVKVDTDDYTKQIMEQDQIQMAVDTVAAVATTYEDKYDYYQNIKDKKNLYKLKATYKNVADKWLKTVKDFKKSNVYDPDYLFVLKQELNGEGFSNTIFGVTSTFETDFEILDYVFANYKTIKKEENPEPKVADAALPPNDEPQVVVMAGDNGDEAPYVAEIDTVLQNYFYKISNAEYTNNQKELRNKGLKYYKKHIELQDFKSSKVRNYMYALSNNLDDTANLKEYFEVFEGYFNKIVFPNKNLIESLDTDFTANTDNESDWKTYKDNFATDCNQVAWAVVKAEKNTNQIQKAIKWSETSLQLQKGSHYFWDTLGQLFYLNGQKEKGLEAEQKAIEFAKGTEEEAEYRRVLETMKNGNYTIPKN